jgi:tetratricopeptide (TPR) repeat protein
MERGAELAEGGEPEKAKLEYMNVLKLDKEHVGARLALARLFEEQGNFKRAVGHYVVAVDNDPTNVEARVRLAQYMLVSGELDRALEVSEEAFELAPEDVDVLAVRASTAYQLGNTEQGLELATRAVEAEPLHAPANVVLISDRVRNGEITEALAMTDAILAAHEEDLSLHLLRLRLLEMQGRDDAALEQLEEVVARFPEVVSSRRVLAERYATMGEYEKAEEQLREVVALQADELEPKLDLVRFVLRTRGLDPALAELRAQIETASDPWPLRRGLAELLYANDRREEARTVLEAVAEEESSSASLARVVLARNALAEGDTERGEALVDAALEQDPDNVDALAMRAALQIERGEHETAIETLRTGLAVEPNDVRLLLLSGQAHLLSGDETLGSDQLATATRVSDYAPNVAERYVNYLLGRGRIDGAEAVMSEVARRAPDNRAVLATLAQLRLRQQDWVGAETVAAQLRELDGGADIAEDIVAASLSGQQRFDESASVLRGLLEQDGDSARRLAAFVNNLVAGDRAGEAVEFLDRLIDGNPDNVVARLLRASVAERSGERDEAVAMLETMRDDFPQNADVYVSLARYRMQDGDTEAADALLREGIEATGGDPRLRLALAGRLEREGDFTGAREQYEAVYEAEPRSLIAANNLASTLADHFSDEPGALERARSIVTRLNGTEVPEMQDTLGWVLYLSGEHAEALEHLEKAVAGLPDNAIVNYHVGMAYAANERPGDARRHLERALALGADQPFPHADRASETLASLGSN